MAASETARAARARRISSPRARPFWKACGGTAESVLKHGEASRPFYESFTKKMALLPDELEKAVEAE